MKIDIHTHIMPEKMPNWVAKFGYGDFIHVEHRNCKACMMKGDKVFRQVEDNCYNTSSRIQEMNDTGVDMQVLSTIPVLFNYWAKPADGFETSRFFNDHIGETVIKNPKRFLGLGTVPLQDIELAIQEMERCMQQLKMVGVEIGSNVNGMNLGDEVFFPFYVNHFLLISQDRNKFFLTKTCPLQSFGMLQLVQMLSLFPCGMI
jgi:aminocarboxymuconate-semialdehyde decarboxylase